VVVVTIALALVAVAVPPTLGAEPPVPRPNPSTDAEAEEVVRPEPNPLVEDTDLPEDVPQPEPSPFGEETAPEPANEEALAVCEAELRKLGGVFERLPMIDGEGACGMAAPYRPDRVGRDVRIEPASQMTCETALAFARWVNKVVAPATDALGDDTRLVKIRQGSTYVCRQRNNLESEKVSYHAFGLAIDVVSFEFDGHAPIAVVPRAGDGNLEEAFQRAVRGGACLYFTTVLGPGTDSFHGDHLHLDIAQRNRGYRMCQ